MIFNYKYNILKQKKTTKIEMKTKNLKEAFHYFKDYNQNFYYYILYYLFILLVNIIYNKD
jgi:hypothetical protein